MNFPSFSLPTKLLTIGTLTLSATFLFSSIAQSQLAVSPLVVESPAERGQAQTTINVSNTSQTPLRLRVYAQPFTYNRDTGFEALKSSPSDLSSYLQFSPKELTIEPGGNRRVRVLAQLAPNLPEGEYRAVVFTEDLSENRDKNGVNIRTRIGTTFYVRKGNLAPQLSATSATFDSANNQIKLLVQNQGKASVRPAGTWNLKQDGKVVKTGEFFPTGIVASSERNFLIDAQAAPGNYQFTGELVWSQNETKKTLPFNLNLTIPAK